LDSNSKTGNTGAVSLLELFDHAPCKHSIEQKGRGSAA
jgi:hypothetical protein